MTTFDDYEPEDAWDPSDPPSLLVRNLLARLALLIQSDGLTFRDDVEMLEDVLKRVRIERPMDRDILRADDLAADIAFLKARLS